MIGETLLSLSKLNDGIERVIAFSSIIAKAYKARIEKAKKRKIG